MMQSKGFLIVWSVLTGVSLLAVGLFNWQIDPFCAYAAREGFTVSSAKRMAGERAGNRVICSEIARHTAANTLLLGSSRCHMGIDPNHEVWGQGVTVNLGLMGPSIFEVTQLFKFAVAQHKPQRVVFFADFFMFAKDARGRADFGQSLLSRQRDRVSYHGDLLLSKYITRTSYNVYRQEKQAAALSPSDTAVVSEKAGERGSRELMAHKLQQVVKDFYSGVYHSDSMKHINEVIKICREQNIELTIVMLPVHALQLEGIRYNGLWDTFEHWKQQMVAAAGNDAVLWDFTGYQTYHTEPVPAAGSNKRMKLYSDMSHCTQLTGGWVISRINGVDRVDGQSLHDFGVKLTAKNVATHLARIRSDGARFVEANPEMVDMLRQADDAVKKYYRKHPRRGVLAAQQDKVYPCRMEKG